MDIYIGKSGLILGPYDPDEVGKRLADGRYDGSEFAYHEGLDEWVNVKELELPEAVEATNNVAPDLSEAIDIIAADDVCPSLDGCRTCDDVIDRVGFVSDKLGSDYRVTQVLFIGSFGGYGVLNIGTGKTTIDAPDREVLHYTTWYTGNGVDLPDDHKIGLALSIYEDLEDLEISDISALEGQTQLTTLNLGNNQITDLSALAGLTQLTHLYLGGNQLTNVKGLEKLTQLEVLWLDDNPDLTKAQIDELQKALPKCKIKSNPPI